MDAMTFWRERGTEQVKQLCEATGTTYSYWKHIANRRKRPSVDLARRMVEYTEGVLTLDELLPPRSQMRVTDAKPVAEAAG